MSKSATLQLGISCLVLLMFGAPQNTSAAGSDRSGKEVVDATCASCHQAGENDAPKIGDSEAWKARTSQGLTTLTKHALDGIRQMPAHGGQPRLTDLEIARAITYMVNESGGNWAEPASAATMMSGRTGQEIVEQHCGECHESGKNSAPRIGDTAAWVPRLRQGIHYAVRSAINGHGGMPPRGGAADLTDDEIRKAVVYMFNPKGAGDRNRAETRVVSTDPNYANVNGTDMYLGYVSAEAIRNFPPESVERSMHGGIPSGDDWYHLNVSLLDQATHAPVTDAQVEVRIRDARLAVVSKSLEPMAVAQGSYGNYFRMKSGILYHVMVSVETPGSSGPIEAEFLHVHN